MIVCEHIGRSDPYQSGERFEVKSSTSVGNLIRFIEEEYPGPVSMDEWVLVDEEAELVG